jgi:hypothetical protein
MTTRALVMIASLVAAASVAQAQQTAPRTPPPPRDPAAPQAPAVPRAATPPAAPVAPAPPAAVVAPRRGGQPINIKVELTITDLRAGTAPVKKTVTIVTGDGWSGSLRSTANFVGVSQEVPLNVDAEPSIQADGKIRLSFNLQYDLPIPVVGQDPASMRLTRTNIRESMTVILESGKAITVAQSADPTGERQVTVEVLATILK